MVLPSNECCEGGAEIGEFSADSPQDPEELGAAAPQEGRDYLAHRGNEWFEMEGPECVVAGYVGYITVGTRLVRVCECVCVCVCECVCEGVYLSGVYRER